MGARLLLELLILVSPFAIFGLYRIAVAEATAEGRKPWPVQRLFIIGFVLAILAWVALMVLEERNPEGERNVRNIGVPASNDPGGSPTNPQRAEEGDD